MKTLMKTLLIGLVAIGIVGTGETADKSLRIEPAEATSVDWGIATIEADYERSAEADVDRLSLILDNPERSFDLSACLPGDVRTQLESQSAGHLRFPLTVRYLPPGTYTARLGLRLTERSGHGRLQGNGMLATRGAPSDGDYTLRYRFKPLDGGHNLMLRVPEDLSDNRSTWNFYFVQIKRDNMTFMLVRNRGGNRLWESLKRASIPKLDRTRWHTLTVRCDGFEFRIALDGEEVLSVADPDQRYRTGGIGFWNGNSLFDDVRITPPDGGDPLFADDFSGDALDEERWNVSEGNWRILPGAIVIVPPQKLATIQVPQPETPPALPRTEIRRIGDANTVWVNDEPLLPIMLAISTLQRNSNDPYAYELPRRSSMVGMPVIVPTLSNSIGLRAGNKLDFTVLDDQLTRLASACPDSYFILRLSLPQPPGPTADERIDVRYSPDEDLDPDKKAAIMRRFARYSTASETYRDFAVSKIGEVFDHLASQPYAGRILGMTMCGIGYEGNWGAPGSPYGTVIDNAPAMHRLFGEFLKETYGTEDALRAAWNEDDATFSAPRVPGLRERFESDFVGFRDPGNPARRPTMDFNRAPRGRTLRPLWEAIHERATNMFMGSFGLFSYPTRNAALDRMGSGDLHRHPAIKFVVGCLTGTRRAGDVTMYTNAAFESARLHRTIALGEADIRTVLSGGSQRRNKTFHDTIQVMRREFGHTILAERQAIWYYELIVGWFDHPLLNAEFAAQIALGRQVMRIPHAKVSDAVVIVHGPGWRTWAGWSQAPMEPGFRASRGIHEFVDDCGRNSIGQLGRAGMARDVLQGEDLFHPEVRDYRLVVFPYLFHADTRFRDKVHALASEGATVFLTYAAGITDETSIGLENMRDLLGMEVAVEERMRAMVCRVADGDHAILRDLPAGTKLGNSLSRGYAFHVTDPDAVPLAVFEDGSTAIAVKPMGKGHIVYSAVPIVQPAFFRALGRFAGCHIYTESNDDLRAARHFIMLHTGVKSGGERTVRLPRTVGTVYDLVSGRTIATQTNQFNISLPSKTTGLYYIGGDPEWVRGLSLGVFSEADEPVESDADSNAY